jgi:integrase
MYLPVLLAFYGGLRRGEALALTWDNVLEDEGAVVVTQAWDDGGRLKGPKSEHSERTVHLPEQVMAAITAERFVQDRRREDLGERYVGGYTKPNGPRNAAGYLVICEENGSPWPPASFSSAYIRFRKAGTEPAHRFHDLRHSHGYHCLKSWGYTLKEVSERLGHHSVAFTADVYQKVLSEDRTDGAARIGATIAEREAARG